MASLVVLFRGEEVCRVNLESGSEYTAGRASDAQIVLPKERGISRHHLKFYEKNGLWICESLSKFGSMQKAGVAIEVLELRETCTFGVPPFEFCFTASQVPQQAAPVRAAALPTFYQPHQQPANHEATIAGAPANLVPFVRVSLGIEGMNDEILKLEGHLWVAGRDPNCEIPIDSPHVSRKHFELVHTKEGYFLTDLGSSNGTRLNGQRIPPHEPTQLESGDEIQVKNVSMGFEIRDTNFNQRIDALAMPEFDPLLAISPAVWYPPTDHAPTELRGDAAHERGRSRYHAMSLKGLMAMDRKKLVVRGALILLIPFMIIMGFLPEKPTPGNERAPAANPNNNSVSFEKLTLEQRSVVKDSFNLARNLYVQGKYELCLTEMAKLHELIPQYENSKELQSFCEQGRELVQRQRDLDRKQREKEVIEQQLAGYIENCKAKLTEQSSVDETRQCLAEAIELDPEHHRIVEMIHTAQLHEEERKFLAGQRRSENEKAQKGMAQYGKAHQLYKDGQLAKALLEFDRFINTPYPRSQETKNNARREVASIKKELKAKVGFLIGQCTSLGAKARYRDAYLACVKAVEEDPNSEVAKETRDRMMSELKRELKAIYEDSVLEESMGNGDSAKEKWKKILKEDVNNGEYWQKANGKLQKYGVGN